MSKLEQFFESTESKLLLPLIIKTVRGYATEAEATALAPQVATWLLPHKPAVLTAAEWETGVKCALTMLVKLINPPATAPAP